MKAIEACLPCILKDSKLRELLIIENVQVQKITLIIIYNYCFNYFLRW